MNPNSKGAGDELRELYRKTLAAELSCHAGDPSADEVIEDIFSGGDGWGPAAREASGSAPPPPDRRPGGAHHDDGRNWSDGSGGGGSNKEKKPAWPDFGSPGRRGAPLPKQAIRDSLGGGKEDVFRTVAQRPGFGQGTTGADGREEVGRPRELDEMEVVDDLKCWLSRPVP
jgi:hypothetical protein